MPTFASNFLFEILSSQLLTSTPKASEVYSSFIFFYRDFLQLPLISSSLNFTVLISGKAHCSTQLHIYSLICCQLGVVTNIFGAFCIHLRNHQIQLCVYFKMLTSYFVFLATLCVNFWWMRNNFKFFKSIVQWDCAHRKIQFKKKHSSGFKVVNLKIYACTRSYNFVNSS